MTLGHDELTRPLGMETASRPRRRVAAPLGNLFAMAVAMLLLALAGYIVVVKDPYGGEPYAVATITRAKVEPPPVEAVDPPQARVVEGSPDIAPPNGQSAADIEKATGVRVVRGNGERAGGIVIQVPQTPIKLAVAPDKRLIERSRHGALPKLGPDGSRPADVYARPAPMLPAKTVGRIAIVMSGMGLSQSSTSDSIVRLPGEVTLAFAPYGAELERQVARAREDGHEVMLQAPMEPFDYPDNDPGPHTLLASGAAENLDRLFWVMSRFSGYIGVMNHMGAKFTASEAALTPVLKEFAARGLVVLDDGASARSLIPAVAGGLKLPAAKADTVIDATPKASAIDDQLARLEAIARERGVAVGTASALPVSIDRIAAWAKNLEARGFVLVPLSAAIAKPGRV
ncbi:divergent polysaccharide deacetylase family protein [Alsobacter metallidurans]|uniref:divergent polysaccharide deacetylase family protein n=1 Tax=Alsobacter metallidurans TaxID=340221 RepID=UPI0016670A43|nr:divergent polysaccharide deacetylase family protein [Alsobacter metallidurans]